MAQRAFLALSLLFSIAHAALRNFTIDDTNGDEITGVKPVYGGGGTWRARTSQSDCSDCSINPDPSAMNAGTWHDATTFVGQDPSTVEFYFNGTAVYIFCALAGDLGNDAFTQSHFTLEVDDTVLDHFDWTPTQDSPKYQYKYPVMAARNLKQGSHSVAIISKTVNISNVAYGSAIIFDYALYSGEDVASVISTANSSSNESTAVSGTAPASAVPTLSGDSSSATRNLTIGLAIGLGVVALITALILLAIVIRSRRASRSRWDEDPRYHPQSDVRVPYQAHPLLTRRLDEPGPTEYTPSPANSETSLPLQASLGKDGRPATIALASEVAQDPPPRYSITPGYR